MSAWGGYGLALVCLCVFDGLGGRKTRNLSPGVQCYNLSSTLRALLCLRGSRDRRAGPVASLSEEGGGERGGAKNKLSDSNICGVGENLFVYIFFSPLKGKIHVLFTLNIFGKKLEKKTLLRGLI